MKDFETGNPDKRKLITQPDAVVSGFDLARKYWVLLKRVRTENGRGNDALSWWRFKNNAACHCRFSRQIIEHIVCDCCLDKAFAGTLGHIY